MRACVDIGGTKIAVSLVEKGSQKLLARQKQPTVKTGANDAVAQQVMRLIDAACAEAGVPPDSIDAVAVSSAGPFVLKDGCVELASPNICGGLADGVRRLQPIDPGRTESRLRPHEVANRHRPRHPVFA